MQYHLQSKLQSKKQYAIGNLVSPVTSWTFKCGGALIGEFFLAFTKVAKNGIKIREFHQNFMRSRKLIHARFLKGDIRFFLDFDKCLRYINIQIFSNIQNFSQILTNVCEILTTIHVTKVPRVTILLERSTANVTQGIKETGSTAKVTFFSNKKIKFYLILPILWYQFGLYSKFNFGPNSDPPLPCFMHFF